MKQFAKIFDTAGDQILVTLDKDPKTYAPELRVHFHISKGAIGTRYAARRYQAHGVGLATAVKQFENLTEYDARAMIDASLKADPIPEGFYRPISADAFARIAGDAKPEQFAADLDLVAATLAHHNNPASTAAFARIRAAADSLRQLNNKAAAFDEWIEKTDWVQEQIGTFPVQALGKHRADVMRYEIERLRTAPAGPCAFCGGEHAK